jgi:tRNA(fMet)-specific endonuclease VapC
MTATDTAERGLLDTSTFIHSERITRPEEALPAAVCLSAVSLAELSLGPLLVDDPEERAKRQQHIQLAAEVPVLPFDTACAQAFALIAAHLRAEGSKNRARAYDALIAATAIANGLPLYTGSAEDFEGIPGLDLRPVSVPRA